MSKRITVGQLRNLLNQLDSEEISFSKMAEILNETNRDIRIENDNLNFVIKEQTAKIIEANSLLRELVMREKLCFPETIQDAEWLDDGRSIELIYKIEELLGIGGGA